MLLCMCIDWNNQCWLQEWFDTFDTLKRHGKIFPQDTKGKKRERRWRRFVIQAERGKRKEGGTHLFLSSLHIWLVILRNRRQPQLSITVEKKGKICLERVIRHWKCSNSTMRFLQAWGLYMPYRYLLVEFTQSLMGLAFCLLALQNVCFEM